MNVFYLCCHTSTTTSPLHVNGRELESGPVDPQPRLLVGLSVKIVITWTMTSKTYY